MLDNKFSDYKTINNVIAIFSGLVAVGLVFMSLNNQWCVWAEPCIDIVEVASSILAVPTKNLNKS